MQKKHSIQIIGYEADEGVSGITPNRPGFKRLFSKWIKNKELDFEYVLVLDVSRWGRFQNPDEAGYYDFLCTEYNRRVAYVDRGLSHNPQDRMIRSMITMIDRYSAGEYSRQLSDKVWHGCVKVVKQGLSPGGKAPFGMSRQLLDERRRPVRILKSSEHKAISNQRVRFVPNEDAKVVKKVYLMYVDEGKNVKAISSETRIKESRISSILCNERYTGAMTYNKSSSKLKQPSKRNPREEWIISYGVLDSIVEPEVFSKAQFIRKRQRYAY